MNLLKTENLLAFQTHGQIYSSPSFKNLPEKNRDLKPISLVDPRGIIQEFVIEPSTVLSLPLSQKYPEIKSYRGYRKGHPKVIIRLTVAGKYVRATVFDGPQSYHLKSLKNRDYILATYDRDIKDQLPKASCGSKDVGYHIPKDRVYHIESDTEANLKQYRLAVTTTGEWAQSNGGDTTSVLTEIVSEINLVNEILLTDLGLKLILVDNTDDLIYLDPATDPFQNSGDSDIDVSTTEISSKIGEANYDIGHVFGTGGGGVAFVGSACGEIKGGGYSGDGSFFTYHKLLAHELGHQMGANHTWNSCGSSNSQRSGTSAMEPGSGTTLMSYAGICGSDNIQPTDDRYFHGRTLEQISNFVLRGNGSTCVQKTPFSNAKPAITIPYTSGFYIPRLTPFQLDASATDADGDRLTYTWEQMDAGNVALQLGQQNASSPLFRSFVPDTITRRIVPQLSDLLNNTSSTAELLPTFNRDINFRFVVRDNNTIGGISAWDDMDFKVTNTAGPFKVEEEANRKWTAGSYERISWDVANTNGPIVNCQKVNIFAFYDNDASHFDTLAMEVPNQGSTYIIAPDSITSNAKIWIEAADNIFLDVLDTPFEIAPAGQPDYSIALSTELISSCGNGNESIQFSSIAIDNYNDSLKFEITSDIPTDVQASFEKSKILVSQTNALNLNLTNLQGSDDFTLTVQVSAPGLDTTTSNIVIDIIEGQLATPNQIFPNDGDQNLDQDLTMRWNAIAGADRFTIEVSPSPDFTPENTTTIQDVLFQEYNLLGLLPNQQYFWRVSALNECSVSSPSEIQSFHTVNKICKTYHRTNVNKDIPAAGTPTITDQVTVDSSFIVEEVLVENLNGTHSYISDLQVSLSSPGGTDAVLFDSECGGDLNFDISFDQKASAITCPLDQGKTHRPSGNLGIFKDEQAMGNWVLTIEDMAAQDGGELKNWSLKFCKNLNINAPSIAIDTLTLQGIGTSATVETSNLSLTDTDTEDVDLVFTLTKVPTKGTLTLNSASIDIGSTFTNADIKNSRLTYSHTGSQQELDSLTFTVVDGTGGHIGTRQLIVNIEMSTSVSSVYDGFEVNIYPNPAHSSLFFEITSPDAQNLQHIVLPGTLIELIGLNGRVVMQGTMGSSGKLEIDVSSYHSGLYFLRVHTLKGIIAEKVSIVK